MSEKIKGKETYGYIDCQGNYVITPRFLKAYSFDDNGLAIVGGQKHTTDINGKPALAMVDGLINKKGDTIVPFNYFSISELWNIYEAQHSILNDKATLFDKYGSMIGTFDNVIRFKDNSIVVIQNDKYGILDQDGKTILPPIADKVNMLYQAGNEYMSSKWDLFDNKGIATYYIDGKQGGIKRNGEVALNPMSDKAFEFVNLLSYQGTVRVKRNGKWGFMDTTLTKVIIPLIYEDADNFYSNYAAVKLNGKYGFIDLNQNTILPFQYDHAYSFLSYGEARVVLNGVKMTIDAKGNWLDKPAQPAPKKNCLQSCTDCGGTGTRMFNSASQCSYCSGTGKSGSTTYTIGGRTQVESKACGICGGSGRGFGSNTTFEYCKTCNHTGCLKFE